VEAAQSLDIDVHQLAWPGALVGAVRFSVYA
jgi:hypothetical protein